jgi:FkbM family methyltransferase
LKSILLKQLKKIYNLIYFVFAKLRITQEFLEIVLQRSWEEYQIVNHNRIQLRFIVPNSLNRFRASTFSTKEPETLEWIDSTVAEKSVLWDIGANVGLYSCYAAKSKDCKVFAFEPSVFNLELLARNIYNNNLSENIIVLPIPLCEKLSINQLNMSTTDWGGALSTFGKYYGHDGKDLNKVFSYQLMGFSIDEAVSMLKVPPPDYIKMDVDGIEQLILSGAKNALKKIKSIILEVNEDFHDQNIKCEKYLLESGLRFQNKRHSEMFEKGIFQNTYNQIWIR